VKLNITSVKLTGNPGPAGWTQAHEFKPEDEDKLAKRGRLFAVVTTSRKEDGVDSVIAGRELIARLHEEYFGNIESTAFVALKSSLQKVIDEFVQSWGNVEIAAISILENVVYSSAGGGAGVSIYREGNIAKILESEGQTVVSASGYPKEGDVLILGTKLFFDILPAGVLKASLEGPNLESSMEYLAPTIHSNSNTEKAGVIIVKFVKEAVFETVGGDLLSAAGKKPFGRWEDRFRGIFTSGSGKFTTLFNKRFPERKIFVKGKSFDEGLGKGRKTTFSVGAALLILLIVSIGFGIKQKEAKKYRARYESRLGEAKDDFDRANSLINVDAKQSRELFINSKNIIDGLLAEKFSDKEITGLQEKLNKLEGSILGVYKSDPELFMDLSLLSSGFKGEKLIASSNMLYVFDKENKKIVKIVIDSKKTQVVAGPDQIEGVSDIAAYEDNIYGLGSDGIYTLGTKKEKVIEKDWEGEVLPYAYSGNIYLLEKGTSKIWRYTGLDGKFGTKQNWIAPGIDINLSTVKSVAIDGNYWLLFSPFKITKLTLGSPQKFSATGVFPDLSGGSAIYSNEETNYVYVLEPSNSRVVVMDKEGQYQAQYSSDKIKEAAGLVVSEKEKKIILLLGDKLFSIELKNL